MRTVIILGIVMLAVGGLAAAPTASAVWCYEHNYPGPSAGAYADWDNAHVEAGPVGYSCEYNLPPP